MTSTKGPSVRIALFATCIAELDVPPGAQATVAITSGSGHEVVLPESQVCCGQMHAKTPGIHAGILPHLPQPSEPSRPVLDGEWDAVVVPSGSCAGRPPRAALVRPFTSGDRRPLGAPLQGRGEDLRSSPSCSSVRPGVTGVGASFPTGSPPPDLHSMRIARVGDRFLRLLERPSTWHRPENAPARRRGVLRLRRHLLDEELRDLPQPCSPTRSPTSCPPGPGVRMGVSLPHASAAAQPPGTRGADHAPGRDPGLDKDQPFDGNVSLRPTAERRRPDKVRPSWAHAGETSSPRATTHRRVTPPSTSGDHAAVGRATAAHKTEHPAAPQLGHAARTIRNKRAVRVEKMPDWEELRRAMAPSRTRS